jgi:hypothetical protein
MQRQISREYSNIFANSQALAKKTKGFATRIREIPPKDGQNNTE